MAYTSTFIASNVVPMTKPLLILSIVLSLGAAVLGYLNRETLVATRTELTDTKSSLDTRTSELAAANKDIEGKKQEITTLSSEKDTLTANLGEAQTELTSTKTQLTAAQEKATAAEAEIASLKTDAEAKDTKIAELEQQAASGSTAAAAAPAPESSALEAQIAELTTVNTQLQDQNTGLTAQVAELQRKEEGRQKTQMRQGLSGTILAVNQAWNFVVLSMGDRQGVVPNAEMLVQRGNQFLGKVRVTSVEPSTSIADILVRTVPRGLTVMPGDRVIYQAQQN
jgi:cell shape-determining protein MreC